MSIDTPDMTDPAAGTRTARLALGLVDLGLGGGSVVVVACCDRHAEDQAVADAAVKAVGGRPVLLDDEHPVRQVPDLVLACEEGYEQWRECGLPGRVVSEVEGTIWWKMLEATHSAVAGRMAGSNGATVTCQGDPLVTPAVEAG